ncbi:layilin [Osmerus eperlanus]|uniref:layilin n=1 Tax=Osmerus eperlanus TaxID=29151 RepID=UPI002E15D9DA
MEAMSAFCFLLVLCFLPCVDNNLIIANMFEARGQRVCRVGKGRPCYKLAYFSEPRRRLNFEEAGLACRRDGGVLLSVESASEQRIIEQLITELRPSDGDFWIGLRRNHGDQDSNEDCPSQYYWLDGSKATFRKWHWDEPSCGYEVCVVMYHQPSAPPGQGGLYMFQWNDDNCETKNNFICKYTTERPPDPSPSENSSHTFSETPPTSLFPWNPNSHGEEQSPGLNLVYVILPIIPLLLLLLMVFGVFCCKLLACRRTKHKPQPEVSQTDPGFCPSPVPSDVYKVIRSQEDADLSGSRPHTKNTSFLGSSPDTPPGDYDNLGGRDTESGFVTLASTESCFMNYELNDLSLGRRGNREPYQTSLRRQGSRDSYDASLSRYGNRESYDKSLVRRAGRSELYGAGSYGDREMYEGSMGGRSEFYDGGLGAGGLGLGEVGSGVLGHGGLGHGGLGHGDMGPGSLGPGGGLGPDSLGNGSMVHGALGPGGLGPGALALKSDLYQTYLINGRDDVYQTSLCRYGSNRKSYDTSVSYYGNEPNLSGGKRYFREAEWVDSDSY